MSEERMKYVDPEEQKGDRTRRVAGKALIVFIAVMVALTWASKILEEMTIATVEISRPQRGALEKKIKTTGVLEPFKKYVLYAGESARVLSVEVTQGEAVKKGAVLYTLDYTDIEEEKRESLETAEEDMKKKQQAVDWAEADLTPAGMARFVERQKVLENYRSGMLTAKDAYDELLQAEEKGAKLDAAKRQYESYARTYEAEKARMDSDTTVRDYIGKEEELKRSQASYQKLQQEYEDMMAQLEGSEEEGYVLSVNTPIKGTVYALGVEENANITEDSITVTLADTSDGIQFVATIDKDSADLLKKGDKATVKVANEEYDTKVASVNPSATTQGQFDVECILPAKVGFLQKDGEIQISKKTKSYDVIVPLNVLRTTSDGDMVFVVDRVEDSLSANSTVRQVSVTILDKDATRAAVSGGLSSWDSIVLRSDRDIASNDRVRVKE